MSNCHTCKNANDFMMIEGIESVNCSVLGTNTVCPEEVVCEPYVDKGSSQPRPDLKSDELLKSFEGKSRAVRFLIRAGNATHVVVFAANSVGLAYEGTENEQVVVFLDPVFEYDENNLPKPVIQ